MIETLTTGPMIPLGTNSSPVARVIDPVMETLTTGPMIPSGTNSPPVARAIDPVIDSLTTGPMIPSGTNSPPVARAIDPVIDSLTTGPMIPSGSNSPLVASYRPCDRNTDYWTDSTLGSNSPPVARVIDPVIETLTTGPIVPSGLIVHQ